MPKGPVPAVLRSGGSVSVGTAEDRDVASGREARFLGKSDQMKWSAGFPLHSHSLYRHLPTLRSELRVPHPGATQARLRPSHPVPPCSRRYTFCRLRNVSLARRVHAFVCSTPMPSQAGL